MKVINTFSIKSKIIALVLCVSGAALLLSALTSLAYQTYTASTARFTDYKINAAIVAQTLTAAITFEDARAANEILAALRLATILLASPSTIAILSSLLPRPPILASTPIPVPPASRC